MSNLALLHKNEITLPRVAPSEAFTMLDVYAENGIAIATPRIDAIATISAGEKAADAKHPTRSTDGRIFLHDKANRAPGLKAALDTTGSKSLTIAFPYDDPSLIIQQRFTEYNASQLLAYGDEKSITVLGKDKSGDPARRELLAGSPDYLTQLKRCKVSVSVYFHLAVWDKNGLPSVDFPDGFGLYRLRFTSRNSLRRIVASLQGTRGFMAGRLAGIPFQLSLENAEVSGPDGSKRRVPVWNCIFATPKGFSLSSQNFRQVANQALEQGANLMLPAPRAGTLENAVHDGEPLDLDEVNSSDVRQLAAGGRCDVDHYRRQWFALVKDSPLDDAAARAKWVGAYSARNGWTSTDSLTNLLEQFTEEAAQTFALDVQDDLDVQYQLAIERYEQRLDEAEGLGITRRELPQSAAFRTIKSYTESLEKAIARRHEASGTHVKEAFVDEPPAAPAPTLVQQVAIDAVTSTPDEQTEIDELFVDEPSVEEGVVVTEDEQGDVPAHIVAFMTHLHHEGVAHGGDFAFEPMVNAINAWRTSRRNPLPPIASVADLQSNETGALVVAMGKGDLKFGLV